MFNALTLTNSTPCYLDLLFPQVEATLRIRRPVLFVHELRLNAFDFCTNPFGTAVVERSRTLSCLQRFEDG